MRVRGVGKAVVIACVAGGGMGASAQSLVHAPADCHSIAVAADRLACYDRATGRRAEPSAAASAPAAPAQATVSEPDASGKAQGARARAATASMLDEAWDFDASSPPYDIRFYLANYLLIGRYTNDVNNAPFTPIFAAAGIPQEDLNHTEAKFQFSFKGRLWTTEDRRWGVWAAYTQQSQWQLYNGDVSRPFRETNYMPELFVSWRPDVALPGDFRWGLLNAGYNHQSNGRSDTLSRSWDRLFVEFGAERENLVLGAKLWYRLPESDQNDDNPDITDYLGHGELSALYRWRGNSFAGWVRGNVGTGKGAAQLGWTSPPFLGPLRAYVQVFSGYGESLIDYNWKQTTVGAGIALSDGL